MNTVAIIQARLGSTRLPGKVLMDLAGEPMLAWVVERTRRAARVDHVLVATTSEPRDDALVALCKERGWPYYRGSQNDVLDRYYHAARRLEAEIVVRITSDCPLMDPALVDQVVGLLVDSPRPLDYASNVHPRRTYPRGLDVEAIRMEVLERVWREATDAPSREHVTLYVANHPEWFQIDEIVNDRDYSDLRWTVDTPEDLELARRICNHFGKSHFGWREIIKLVERQPELRSMNHHIAQKPI